MTRECDHDDKTREDKSFPNGTLLSVFHCSKCNVIRGLCVTIEPVVGDVPICQEERDHDWNYDNQDNLSPSRECTRCHQKQRVGRNGWWNE